MVGNDVPERRRRVHDAPLVDGVDYLLTRRRAEEVLALRQDGHLERWEHALGRPGGLALGLIPNMAGGVLEGLEACDQDMRKQQQTLAPFVVFVKAPEDASRDELAEGGACPVHILAIGQVGLLLEEIGAIDQQTVNYKSSQFSVLMSKNEMVRVCLLMEMSSSS